VCLDEMGPESAKSWPGQRVVVRAPRQEPARRPAGRARQEIDYGRRESGYVFGAFCPATGDALTAPYTGRTIANWLDFLERVEGWLAAHHAGAGLRRAGQPEYPPGCGCAALPTDPSPLGVCLSTNLCGVSQLDRTLVEDPADPAVTGPQGASFRELG